MGLRMVATTDDRLHVAIVLEVTTTTTVTEALVVSTMMNGAIEHLRVVDPSRSMDHPVDAMMIPTDGITHLPTRMSMAVLTIVPRAISPRGTTHHGKFPHIPGMNTVEEGEAATGKHLRSTYLNAPPYIISI